jgi:hypothetical protein
MIDTNQPIRAKAEDYEVARFHRPHPVSRGLNRHYDLSELMAQTMSRMVRTNGSEPHGEN